MPPTIQVNGAELDRAYLEMLVKDARGQRWEKATFIGQDHAHCGICNVTIEPPTVAYGSGTGWLCTYCYGRFIS